MPAQKLPAPSGPSGLFQGTSSAWKGEGEKNQANSTETGVQIFFAGS